MKIHKMNYALFTFRPISFHIVFSRYLTIGCLSGFSSFFCYLSFHHSSVHTTYPCCAVAAIRHHIFQSLSRDRHIYPAVGDRNSE